MKAIQKIKNFEGYVLNCQCCGKELQHAYMIDGDGCYGKDCVIKLAINGKEASRVKKQMSLMVKKENKFDINYKITPDYYNGLANSMNISIQELKLGWVNGEFRI